MGKANRTLSDFYKPRAAWDQVPSQDTAGWETQPAQEGVWENTG